MKEVLKLKGVVMPSNYLSIDDEMEYVDEGWSLRTRDYFSYYCLDCELIA